MGNKASSSPAAADMGVVNGEDVYITSQNQYYNIKDPHSHNLNHQHHTTTSTTTATPNSSTSTSTSTNSSPSHHQAQFQLTSPSSSSVKGRKSSTSLKSKMKNRAKSPTISGGGDSPGAGGLQEMPDPVELEKRFLKGKFKRFGFKGVF